MYSGMRIAFFGSRVSSAYENGAATYFRGMLRALADRGHRVTFYEPDVPGQQQHRDLDVPSWASVEAYSNARDSVERAVQQAGASDLIVKASGVGVFDEFLEAAVLDLRRSWNSVVFWDVDAPATLDRLSRTPDDPFQRLIPRYDLVFVSGGGRRVASAYVRRGARRCVPVYAALDAETHHPVAPDARFEGMLGFMGNRLPDREVRFAQYFLRAAERLPNHGFVLGGSGWDSCALPDNVRRIGHVGTADHNAFNLTPRAILSVNTDSMVKYGFSPSARMFEAAGAGGCLITDAWEGLEEFLEPRAEVLVADNGEEVAELVDNLSETGARQIGQRARARALAEHTYAHRALLVEQALGAGQRGRATLAGARS